jgi:SAM-dependent methyltransferase
MTKPTKTLKNSPKLLTPVVRAYERRLKQFGPEARGVFWKDEDFQRQRYDILSQVFDDADQAGGITIHDFGCGYGALFDYLKDQPVMHASRYIGTDMSSEMITAAQNRIADPRASFLRHLMAIDQADVTFASGTYNMHVGQDEEDWEDYVKASLKQLWGKTRKAMAFNMLRDDVVDRYDGLYYINGRDLFEFCTRELSPNVTIQNDSPLPDWTFFVRRD